MDLNEELSIDRGNRLAIDGNEIDWQRPDNRFIPLRATDLAEMLLEDAAFFGCTTEQLQKSLAHLRSRIEQETLELRHQIENEYAAFDPDRETQSRVPLEEHRTASHYDQVFDRLNHLLDKANFEKLTDIQIEHAIRKAKSRRINVRVHSEKIEHLDVWVRGQGIVRQRTLSWRHPIAGVEIEASVFKRMAVIARLRDDPHVIVKLFKDIPEADVEALLPHAQATMTWFDRIKLFGSGAGAVGVTLFKLFSIAISFAALSKLVWILLIGLITLAARTIFGYRNVRKTRIGQRVRNLYFQNLSNNSSAIQLVVAMLKQEELKEAYLGYAFSNRISNANPFGQLVEKQAVRAAVEEYLLEKLDASVDFDIDDAAETLVRLGFARSEDNLKLQSEAF